jgi:hypothetical protein
MIGLVPIILPIPNPTPGRIILGEKWWHIPNGKELLLGLVRGVALFAGLWLLIWVLAQIAN